MKFFLQSFDARGNIDPSIEHGLIDFLPGRVDSEAQADCVIVPVSYTPNYQFNEALNRIEKPIIVFDYLEFGWNAGDKENRLGYGIDRPWFSHLESDEWTKLDKWEREHPAALTFKRELFERDHSERLLPIEWPCRIPAPPLQSKQEFDARPIEVFFQWGLSNPCRPQLHGDIFRNAHASNINVVDSLGQRWHDRTWATIHTPHYMRVPIFDVMQWQQQAKISVSLPGAGVKCFRHCEAPVGSIMALPEDNLAWTFPWVHGENCIRLRTNRLFDDLESATNQDRRINFNGVETTVAQTPQGLPDLWQIYQAGQETIDLYRSQRFAIEYVLPAIEAML